MAKTPLLRGLLQLARDTMRSDRLGLPVDEVRERRAQAVAERRARGAAGDWSRRDVLRVGAGVAAGAVLASAQARAGKPSPTQPRVAIIGGGIAGLTGAMTLADAGYSCTIYEAMPTIGGRMRSERSVPVEPGCGSCHAVSRPVDATWADGQVTDTFGELIDTGHTAMLDLAARFNLPLIDLLAAEPAGATETYHFLGDYYRKADADADFAALYPIIRGDLHDAGYPTTWDFSKAAGRALDAMSIEEWIASRVPGGHGSALGRLLDVAYNIEFGAETSDQSALNLLYLLGYSPSHTQFSVFGESDERFRIADGVGQLPKAIAAYLGADTIRVGQPLEALVRRSDGAYDLLFDGAPSTVADLVLMTAPFAALRNLDIAQAGFDARKLFAINELGAGHNGKLQLQFTRRLWNEAGPWGVSGGSSYADTGYQVSWEATRGQGGQSGILVVYTGGAVTDAQKLHHPYGTGQSGAVQQDASFFLSCMEPVYPGLSALWNGRAAGAMAHVNPFWNCSYSYWRTGQYQTIAGYERVRQGNVFFAGEHTSVDYQGWMEGAAREGVRAGNEMVRAIQGH